MIRRHIADGAMVVWLPNELIFEICRSLFHWHYLETETISRIGSGDDDNSDDADNHDDGSDEYVDDSDDDDDAY